MQKAELIVALDFPDKVQALKIIDELDGVCNFFKIGMELGLVADDEFIKSLIKRGKKIFLDYKYHDIGNTVESAVKNAADLGVYMLTVHAEEQVLEAAVRGAAGKTKVFGVTVLTSLDNTYSMQNYNIPLNALVEKRAGWARKAGANGVICSPLEAGNIKSKFPTLEICTPGIRPTSSDKDDQQRTTTPAQAIQEGANYLVVGRPITKATSPRQASQDILKEMSQS